MFSDDFVHHGLGKRGLIEFVVTEFTVADQVDNDIAAELLAEFSSEAESAHNVSH